MSKHARRHENQAASMPSTTVDQQDKEDQADIAKLAYENWLAKGCPPGTAEEDWLEAERALKSGMAVKRSAG